MLLANPECGFTLKPHTHPRLTGLPLCRGSFFLRIPGVEALHRLVGIRGTVTRLGPVRMLSGRQSFTCAKCNTPVEVLPDHHQYGVIPRPTFCLGTVDDERCNSTKFEVSPPSLLASTAAASGKEDYQEIRIQEQTSHLEIGAVPRSITVILRHDLADLCKAGDDVTVIGWMIARWKPSKAGQRVENEFCMMANNVLIANSLLYGAAERLDAKAFATSFWAGFRKAPLQGRDALVRSFCPQIFGLHLVKLAVLLTVIGGCDQEAADGMDGVDPVPHDRPGGARRHRREGHLLLVGDPGTAKSQFLLSAARLSPRSVITTGSGSTNAGLTVAAVKDAGEWQLEAGALVLADRGVCCIDEFNGLRAHDRTAIHEAMEQQTLSVAKAGLVCKLQTRCSIVAACNSKGRFEEGEPISANVAFASPLLSRFDLIIVMTDKQNEQWDRSLSDALLAAARTRDGRRQPPKTVERIDAETLASYVNYVRIEKRPAMSPGCRVVLGKYYQLQRRADLRDAARTTIRLLESLIRLAQAHAKLMHQDSAEISDAVWAIVLMETSLATQSTLEMRPDVYLAAPSDPLLQYQQYEAAILQRLEINPRVINAATDLSSLDADADRILCSWPATQSAVPPKTLD